MKRLSGNAKRRQRKIKTKEWLYAPFDHPAGLWYSLDTRMMLRGIVARSGIEVGLIIKLFYHKDVLGEDPLVVAREVEDELVLGICI